MSLPTIRAAIVATLQAIPDIGVVHDYERFARGEKEFREMYESAGRILGWHVRRVATRQLAMDVDDTTPREDTHTWQIRGFMGLDDAGTSELLFDALIEAIRDAFRLDDTLDGAVATCITDDGAGIQVDDSGPVMFAGVLCHGTTLTLRTVTLV